MKEVDPVEIDQGAQRKTEGWSPSPLHQWQRDTPHEHLLHLPDDDVDSHHDYLSVAEVETCHLSGLGVGRGGYLAGDCELGIELEAAEILHCQNWAGTCGQSYVHRLGEETCYTDLEVDVQRLNCDKAVSEHRLHLQQFELDLLGG